MSPTNGENASPGHPNPGRPEHFGRPGHRRASHEKFVARRLVEALSEAVTDTDPQRSLARLCRACVELLDVSGASISLSGGEQARTTWWSSDEVAGRLAESQYSLGDGPCQRAVALAAPVLASDLSQGQDARRWPAFAQEAVALGVRAVYSLPLGSEAVVIGTLDLYREESGLLEGGELRHGLMASDAITYALLHFHSLLGGGGPGEVASWLEGAEEGHDEVHQATGMLMYLLRLDPQQALARLRAHAYVHGQSVSAAARDVIERKVSFDE
ncbi:ANTAR domain-containing protein [Streptomyces sp. NPDC004111]|uniref:GAF and ANTAR domain-containing protein n=1 Tax=Streptomyces sp. NPDC004111 TaxID=3364690 RepID=UPI0036863FEC